MTKQEKITELKNMRNQMQNFYDKLKRFAKYDDHVLCKEILKRYNDYIRMLEDD